MPRSVDTTELTWPEMRDALAEGYDTIVVAAGSTEQHGPHLPEMTDALIGTALVRMNQATAGYVGPFDAAVSACIFREGMPALTANGILGDARPATTAHGHAYLAAMADYLARWIETQRA